MAEEMSEQEKAVVAKIQEAFDLLKEGDGLSMHILITKVGDGSYKTIESIKGKEEDIFHAMVEMERDERHSVSKRLFTNFFNFKVTEMQGMLPEQQEAAANKEGKIINLKSKGDA